MRPILTLLASLALALVACGGSDDPVSDAGSDGGDTDRTDGGDASEDSDDAAGEAGTDAPPDATDDVVETGECGDGIVEGDEQCDDGNDDEDDGCANDCTTNNAGLCVACTSDAECGGETDRCIDIAGVMMCGQDCDSERCPRGWECVPVVRGGEILENQCKPVTGDCAICDDEDEDTVCDYEDTCPDGDDTLDADGDGEPDACDPCPDDNPNDSDLDNVCDSDDICDNGNDALDNDEDGTPDACDVCPFDADDDADDDGVCGNVDQCPGFDDTEDLDQDRVPDGCDDSIEDCTDGEDNDGDDIIDCRDSDCALHTACGPCDAPDPIGVETVAGRLEGPSEIEPGSDCGWGGGSEQVFEFVAEESGRFCATTAGSSMDTLLYVRTVCEEPETELGCSDDDEYTDEIGIFTSTFGFEAEEGESVFLFVDGWDDAETGDFQLQVFDGSCDSLYGPEVCRDVREIGEGSFEGAARGDSALEPAECPIGGYGGEEVFAYIPTTTGTVCMNANGTGDDPIDTVLYVRDECSLGSTEIACNDDVFFDSIGESQLELEVVEGERVFVIVDDDSALDEGGTFLLTIEAGGCGG